MERALETQRLKLLRLLAGLAMALGLLSFAPAVSMLPQWVRSYVAALLVRVESAVHSLVIVAACGLLRKQGASLPVGLSFPPLPISTLPDDAPSAVALVRRINRLRAMLEDLPRHAKRMIARSMKPKTEPDAPLPDWGDRVGILFAVDAPIATRIERPPDKRRCPRAPTMEMAPS